MTTMATETTMGTGTNTVTPTTQSLIASMSEDVEYEDNDEQRTSNGDDCEEINNYCNEEQTYFNNDDDNNQHPYASFYTMATAEETIASNVNPAGTEKEREKEKRRLVIIKEEQRSHAYSCSFSNAYKNKIAAATVDVAGIEMDSDKIVIGIADNDVPKKDDDDVVATYSDDDNDDGNVVPTKLSWTTRASNRVIKTEKLSNTMTRLNKSMAETTVYKSTVQGRDAGATTAGASAMSIAKLESSPQTQYSAHAASWTTGKQLNRLHLDDLKHQFRPKTYEEKCAMARAYALTSTMPNRHGKCCCACQNVWYRCKCVLKQIYTIKMTKKKEKMKLTIKTWAFKSASLKRKAQQEFQKMATSNTKSIDIVVTVGSRMGKWMEMYHRLVIYNQKKNPSHPIFNGDDDNDEILKKNKVDVTVPYEKNQHEPMELDLAKWVCKQRSETKLSRERYELLEFIHFGWKKEVTIVSERPTRTIGNQEEIWMQMYERLVEYNYNNLSSLKKQKMDEDLIDWVYRQREKQRSEKKLSKKQYELLESINFKWETKEHKWMRKFHELVEYEKEQGSNQNNSSDHNLVKQHKQKQNRNFKKKVSWTKASNSLKAWVRYQRLMYEGNQLKPMYVDRLNSIGFNWDHSYTDTWMVMYQRYLEYIGKQKDKNEKAGNKSIAKTASTTAATTSIDKTTITSITKIEAGAKLTRWMNKQRYQREKNKLKKDRYDLLESVGFDWYNRSTAKKGKSSNKDKITTKGKAKPSTSLPSTTTTGVEMSSYIEKMAGKRSGQLRSKCNSSSIEQLGAEQKLLLSPVITPKNKKKRKRSFSSSLSFNLKSSRNDNHCINTATMMNGNK